MHVKKQLKRSIGLETFIQVSSVAISFVLIDLWGYPFLANSNNPNTNLLCTSFHHK